MTQKEYHTFNDAATQGLATLTIEERFVDCAENPLSITDKVQIMSGTFDGAYAEVVGLDKLDQNGKPLGDDIVYVRVLTQMGSPHSPALLKIHPRKLRRMRKRV